MPRSPYSVSFKAQIVSFWSSVSNLARKVVVDIGIAIKVAYDQFDV